MLHIIESFEFVHIFSFRSEQGRNYHLFAGGCWVNLPCQIYHALHDFPYMIFNKKIKNATTCVITSVITSHCYPWRLRQVLCDRSLFSTRIYCNMHCSFCQIGSSKLYDLFPIFKFSNKIVVRIPTKTSKLVLGNNFAGKT